MLISSLRRDIEVYILYYVFSQAVVAAGLSVSVGWTTACPSCPVARLPSYSHNERNRTMSSGFDVYRAHDM